MMQNLSVPFREGHLVVTLSEAEQLVKDLAREIENAKQAVTGLRPVAVDEDGFITLDSFYGFFVQVYPDPAILRNHAGKLFGRLVATTMHDGMGFNILCTDCGLHIRERCTKGNFFHLSCNESLKLEVASLKKHAEAFMAGDFRLVGPKMHSDLKLLLNYL